MCGPRYYQSYPLYQMISGNVSDSLNVLYNTGLAQGQTIPYLYNVPIINFNNMSPYMNNNFMGMPNPFDVVGQWNWQNVANGGKSCFDENGKFNPFANMNPWSNTGANNQWGNPWGWNPSANSANQGNSNGLSETEKQYQKKYNKLLSFSKQLANSSKSGLNTKEKAELKEASEHPKGDNWEEKFKNLKKAYDKISDTKVKRFLVKEGNQLGVTKDSISSGDIDSFKVRLENSGYEFKNGTVDSYISSIIDEIKNIKDSDTDCKNIENVIANSTIDILDFVSSWNSYGKNNKHIIATLYDKYSSLDSDNDKNAKEKVESLMTDLAEKLTDKANEILELEVLDEDSAEKVRKSVKEIQDAIKNKNYSNLNNQFDTLYVQIRLASMAILRNDIIDNYGMIDSDVFNNNLFVDEVKEDLENENLKDIAKANEMKISSDYAVEEIDDEEVVDDDDDVVLTAQQSIDKLCKEGILKKVNGVQVINNVSYQLYECTESQEEYIIKDGAIYRVDDILNDVNTPTTVDEIKKCYNEAKEARKNAKNEIDENKELAQNYIDKSNEKVSVNNVDKSPQVIANSLYNYLDGHTDNKDWSKIDTFIKYGINKYNVLRILKIYNNTAKNDNFVGGYDRFFTQILSEDLAKDIKIDNKTVNHIELAEYVVNTIKEYLEDQIKLYEAKIKNSNAYKDMTVVIKNKEQYGNYKQILTQLENLTITDDNGKEIDDIIENLLK